MTTKSFFGTPGTCEAIFDRLQSLPDAWTEVARTDDRYHEIPAGDFDEDSMFERQCIYLDHAAYGVILVLCRDTDGNGLWDSDYVMARCFCKEGRTPTEDEVIQVLAPVLGPDFKFSQGSWTVTVHYDPSNPNPKHWHIDGENGDGPENCPDPYFGLLLEVENLQVQKVLALAREVPALCGQDPCWCFQYSRYEETLPSTLRGTCPKAGAFRGTVEAIALDTSSELQLALPRAREREARQV